MSVYQDPFNDCFVDASDPLFPVKIEVLSHDPVVAIFHDVLTDNDVEKLKHAAVTHLKNPKTVNDGKVTVSHGRTGKVAFITDNPDRENVNVKYSKELSNRMQFLSSRLTNLVTKAGGAEDLQIVSYGIGGHYEPHYDSFGLAQPRRNPRKIGSRGDRIATLLYYLSDLPKHQGGATAFPFLDISIFPKKGSALFWFNLHKNGLVDLQTMHAGCPVIY